MLLNKFEASNASKETAIFCTQSGKLVKQTINPIAGRYFVCKFGMYFIDQTKRVFYENAPVFFYDTRFPYPLDIDAMEDIQDVLRELKEVQLTEQLFAANKDLFKMNTRRFLHDSRAIDYNSVHDFWNNAQESERKPVTNKQSFPPLFKSGTWGIVKLGGKKIDIVKFKLDKKKKAMGQKIGQCKYGYFDLSEVRHRYTMGKASVYFVKDPVLRAHEKGSSGNAVAERTEEMPHDVHPTINMSAYSVIADFSKFDPILVRDFEQEVRFTDRASELIAKKVTKSRMNIIIIGVVVFTAFIIGFNYVINPQLSAVQTNIQRQQDLDAQKYQLDAQKHIEELRLQQLQLQNRTGLPHAPVTP